MPGTRCAVFGCNNTYRANKSGGREGTRIRMHWFPKQKDFISQTVRSEWVRRCNRQDKFNPDTSRICSHHFIETDYQRDLQNELLGLPPKKILKKTAVPTIGIHENVSQKSQPACKSEERHSRKKRKQGVDEITNTSFETVFLKPEFSPVVEETPISTTPRCGISQAYLNVPNTSQSISPLKRYGDLEGKYSNLLRLKS